jgi:NAD(P)-dependent dehydrogenase (short-subunit alcohol dehydrogenase family)
MNVGSDDATVVVGASRGLGHGIAAAFAGISPVIAIARTEPALTELAANHPNVSAEVADATDPGVATRVLESHHPKNVVLVAGAVPVMQRLQDQTWESFSVNWHSDVKIAFAWLQAALLTPLQPGSKVIVISSGAAISGSPASGGYAGAKATQRFITGYAQEEAEGAGLGITMTAVMPRMTPFGEVGRRGIQAYAARSGQTEEEFLQQMGPPLTPDIAGTALVNLAGLDSSNVASAYILTGRGLHEAP